MTTPRAPYLLFTLALFLGACSSTPTQPTTASAPPPKKEAPPPPVAERTPAPATPAPPKVVSVPLPAYLDPQNPISRERSVYFDFDQSTIRSNEAKMIERHGEFLATAPSVRIRLEGNCDERGGREYNLALGQRRANSVATRLKVLGAKDAQLDAISLGKEKPRAPGHDEASWAENRRVDVVYPSK